MKIYIVDPNSFEIKDSNVVVMGIRHLHSIGGCLNGVEAFWREISWLNL